MTLRHTMPSLSTMRWGYLLLLLPLALHGQAPAILQGPIIGPETITRSSASVVWSTNIASTTKIKWGTSATALTNISGPYSSATTDAPVLIHNWYLYGTPANTLIYYQVCSTANSRETCSATNTYTSAAQATVPAEPIPPKRVDAPVTPTGTVWTVGPDCNDTKTATASVRSGLVATWKAAARGDIVEIDPAITRFCAGSYTFPAKSPGGAYIITRVKNADTVFPNKRRANLGDQKQMARMVHNAPNVEMNGTGDPTGVSCFAGALHWRQGQNNAWAMYRCNNQAAKAITRYSSSGALQLTVPNHGIPYGYMVWVTGHYQGGWVALPSDANTLGLRDYLNAPLQAYGPVAAGGSIALNKYQLEPVTEGTTAPSGTCKWGSWYHKKAGSGSEDEYNRTWYCDSNSTWTPFRLDPSHNVQPMPVIDVATNKLDHLMFQGLNFEPLHQKADPQLMQYQYDVTHQSNGNIFWSFVGQSIYNNHIYWDNIVAGCPDPSLTGEMERCDAFALAMDGTHIHVGGSYLYGFQIYQNLQNAVWDGVAYDDNAVVIPAFQGGPLELVNNYIECAGVCVYAPEDIASGASIHDWTLRRNTIERSDKYWNPKGPLLTQGFYFSQRHASERKHMTREEDDGNIFIGGWVSINNAAGYCLCTRTSSSLLYTASVADNLLTAQEPSAVGYGAPFSDIQVGDLVNVRYPPAGATGSGCASMVGKIFTVSEVRDYTHIKITPGTGCTGTNYSYWARLNSRSESISDIYIHNQTWLNNPTDLVWLGHDSSILSGGASSGSIGPVLRRVKLHNNLSIGLDGSRVGQGQYFANPATAPAGSHLNLGEGGEDLIVSHETVIGRTGGNFLVMDYGNGGASQASGLKMTDNIFEYLTYGVAWTDGVAYGKAMLDREWVGTNPPYTLSQNVVLRQGGCGGGGFQRDPCAGPPWGPYPPGLIWHDTNSGAFPFHDQKSGNLRLKPNALYKSGGKHHATDGKDIGVDMDALEAAQGKVSNVRAFDVTAAGATVGFLAPDAVGCPVDWSTDKFATFTRVQNAGGARVQNVPLTGVPSHTAISFRVNCVVMQPTGTFTTQ